MTELMKELQKKKTILMVIPTAQYNETVQKLATQLSLEFNKVAYVSMNKLISPLKRSLEEQKVDMNKFFFIDAITKTAIPNPPEMPNCMFVPSPEDLTKLSIAITKVLQTYDPDCLFFDSLSTILVYQDITILSQFVHSIVNKVNAFGIRAVFTCLDGKKEEQLISDLSLILDGVIRIDA